MKIGNAYVLEWRVEEGPDGPVALSHRFPFENLPYGQPWMEARDAMYTKATELLRANPALKFKAYVERIEALDWFAPEVL